MSRIVVVEDNSDNRLLLQAILSNKYEITDYETGIEALDGMTAHPPDLILLDISLPGMDGTEVLKRMRAAPDLKSLPVIALTAHAMTGDRERFLGAGFDDYVTKPLVDETILLDAITRLLSNSRSERGV
jgi:two-component system cell cycle response regulator DivK